MTERYAVEYDTPARKQLSKFDPSIRLRILKTVDALAADPRGPQPQMKALKGDGAGAYRLRVGEYRVVFDLFDHELVVWVVEVAHRCHVRRYQ